MQSLGTTLPSLGIPTDTAASTNYFPFRGDDPGKLQGLVGTEGSLGPAPDNRNMLQKLFMRKRYEDVTFTGEYQIDPFKAAFAVGAGTYLGGAFGS